MQDSGWAFGINKVDDVNRNGLDEIALEFGGGMHQGESGTGLSLIEFKDGKPAEIGFYVSARITDTEAMTAWKLTAKPGKKPVFYRQKFVSAGSDKWRAAGKSVVYKLERTESEVEEIK